MTQHRDVDYFFFHVTPPTETYTLSLHDALPISRKRGATETEDWMLGEDLKTDEKEVAEHMMLVDLGRNRSEEHTSELQSRFDLVCRLLLEKKKQHEQTSLLDEHPNRPTEPPHHP